MSKPGLTCLDISIAPPAPDRTGNEFAYLYVKFTADSGGVYGEALSFATVEEAAAALPQWWEKNKAFVAEKCSDFAGQADAG